MRTYKHITFAEGIKTPLADFKNKFYSHLQGLTDNEIKEAHKTVTHGNISTNPKKSKRPDSTKNKKRSF